MDEAERSEATCLWCKKAEADCGDGLFVVYDETSGICDRCVGYLMSVIAIDLRSTFEGYVDEVRAYSDNNEAARRWRDAAERAN